MGTHPIFESDFDCLTEEMGRYGYSVLSSSRISTMPRTPCEILMTSASKGPTCAWKCQRGAKTSTAIFSALAASSIARFRAKCHVIDDDIARDRALIDDLEAALDGKRAADEHTTKNRHTGSTAHHRRPSGR